MTRKNKFTFSKIKSSNLIWLIYILANLFTSCTVILKEVEYVNPLIGTSRNGWGAWYPSVSPPFAMTNFTVQTNENIIGRPPYYYEDSTIIGFMGTRQPAQWMGDYGYVSVMPVIGELKVLPNDRKVTYSHKNEIATAYSYSVITNPKEEKSFKAEIAATERSGIIRFTFPETQTTHLVIQSLNIPDDTLPEWQYKLNSIDSRLEKIQAFIQIDTVNQVISGYNPDRFTYDISQELFNFKGYFVIQLNKPFKKFGTWNNDSILHGITTLSAKKRLGAFISFSTQNNETVLVKIGTSLISMEQAKTNLFKEIKGWNFDEVKNQTRNKWQKNLSTIKIESISKDDNINFYTALYHCFIFPREITEYGRYYSAFDDTIHEGISYTDFSLWDTFRALHPLLILTQPKRVSEMINAMLQMYDQCGWLPMWPNPGETNVMIGSHADAVIADAYIKGLKDFNIEKAYNAMLKNAMVPPNNDSIKKFEALEKWDGFKSRAGLSYYKSMGYIPSDKVTESVSRTIEYAYDDYCIAQVAKALNKMDDYNMLLRHSQNYKNLYNINTGFMAPKLYNGQWDNDTLAGFTEGSPWTYLFGAMHDIPGLIEIMGGKDKFTSKLDSNFINNHYRHENEPGHHYPYLYNYTGEYSKTQEIVKKTLATNYFNGPGGINGNDDCGQMSAWYVFSTMGFYPVTPGSGIYAIGVPGVKKTTLHLNVNGKQHDFQIIAKNFSSQNKYVKAIYLDGKVLNSPFINHNDIINGKKLIFEMCNSLNWNEK